jgi:hypothetical protein
MLLKGWSLKRTGSTKKGLLCNYFISCCFTRIELLFFPLSVAPFPLHPLTIPQFISRCVEEDVKYYRVVQNILYSRYEVDADTTRYTVIIQQQNTGPNENIKTANKLRHDINNAAYTTRLKQY